MNPLNALQSIAGQEVSIGTLRELNKALRANAQRFTKGGVGYPQQGVPFVSGAGTELAPLVPQSIQPTLDSSTFLNKHIKFWPTLKKVPITSTLYESSVVQSHGNMDLDPWIGEGGVGPKSEATYARQTVRVKFLDEHIEITDVGTMVGITGVNRSALAQRTQDGTLSLLGKLERQLFLADSNLSALSFDGLYKQIRTGAANNYTDLEGKPATFQLLVEVLGGLAAHPNFAYPTTIMVEPEVWQTLSNQATAHGRHDQVKVRQAGGQIAFGHRELFVVGPYGEIKIEPMPLMFYQRLPNAAAAGTYAPAAPVIASAVNPGATVGSKFYADDAGTYIYRVVAVGDGGITAPVNSAGVAVAAGESVDITITDNAIPVEGEENNSVRYYRVFRSTPGGAAGTAQYMWSFPRAAFGVDTVISDLNEHRTGCSQIYLLQNTPDVVEWDQLLDFVRRPLAQVKTTVPFLLMLFGTLYLKVATKAWVIDNVARSL